MKKSLLIILLITIAISFALITAFVVKRPIIGTQKIYTDLIVTDQRVGGFAIDNDNIRFGKLAPGNVAKRDLHLTTQEPVLVKIEATGNISSFIVVSENNFLLKPQDYKTVTFSTDIPKDTLTGNYSGYIHVTYFKPLFR